MIIVSEIPGQLGNRLFLCAYGMALAEATGQPLIDFSLNEYTPLFPATRWRSQRFYHFTRKVFRVFIKLLRFTPWTRRCFVEVGWRIPTGYSPMDPEFVARIKSRWLTCIDGFPDPALIAFPSTDAIRAKFTPDVEILAAAQEKVNRLRTKAQVVIGLHLRQGDYTRFYHGRYLYPTSFYLQLIAGMQGLFPGRQVAFVVCSTESQPFGAAVPEKVTMGPGTLLGDLHTLAACDYIVGPISTFSLWAAFFGRKPLVQLAEPRVPSSLDEFMVPDGHFECYDFKIPMEERLRMIEYL